MDRSLIHLFNAIHNLRIRPENPLHSYLPTTLTVNVGELPISMILSPRSLTNDEDWAHWGQMNDGSLIDDSDSDSEDGMNKSDTLRIDPWKSLLLVDDDAASKAHEISRALIGVGMGITGPEEDDEDEKTPMGGSRRGSKDMSTAEEDEGLLMKAVIEACDVTRKWGFIALLVADGSLKQIAHALRYDLEGIVIPLARELVTNKKAILIDVITTRLRTIVMPTTIAEHTYDLWNRQEHRLITDPVWMSTRQGSGRCSQLYLPFPRFSHNFPPARSNTRISYPPMRLRVYPYAKCT